MERWLHGALTLSLAPLLLVQGRWVRRRTPLLPEPPGPRAGVIGQGPVLRLLIVGDSSAAGVGVAHQAQQVILSALPPMHLFPALPQPLRWYLGRCATRLDRAQRRWVVSQPGCEVVGADFPMDLRYMAHDGFHPGPLAYEAWAGALAGQIRARRHALVGREEAVDQR